MRLAISRHTRTILGIVSDLLMSYSKSNLTDQDRALFITLMPSWLTPELWLQSRTKETEAALELARVKALLNSAESEYGRVAPLGKMVTGWFSNPQEKAQIDDAKAIRERLRRECQNAESNHDTKLATLHSNAEHFLRNAMSSEGIAGLLDKSSVRTKLQKALDAMNREVSKLWLDHTTAQTESLANVRSATSELLAMYSADHTTTQTPLLGASNAGTRN